MTSVGASLNFVENHRGNKKYVENGATIARLTVIESIIERYHNERVFWDVNKYTNFVNLEVKAAAWQRISFHIQLSNIVCRQRLFPRPLVLCPVAETKCCYRLMLRWEQTTATE